MDPLGRPDAFGGGRGRWSLDAVYALFPRLAERRINMGAVTSPV